MLIFLFIQSLLVKAISCYPSKNQNKVPYRKTSELFYNTCPISYCEGGQITSYCVPDQKCSNGQDLPYCSWLHGSRYELIDNLTGESQMVHAFTHYHHQNIACLPCCLFGSNNPKMPSKIRMISIVNV